MILPDLPTSCTLPGCDRDIFALGMCNAHYQRQRAHGDPLTPTPTEARHLDADEVLFLLSCGESTEAALSRVGWTAAAAYRWALRNDRDDLRAAVCHAESRSRARRKRTAA